MSLILTLNAGSSSLKFSLYDDLGNQLGSGQVRSIGHGPHLIAKDASGEVRTDTPLSDSISLGGMVPVIADALSVHGARSAISAVGHRVVHGGTHFSGPAHASDETVEIVRSFVPLAPAHQPAALEVLAAAEAVFPHASHTLSFDTSFHRTQSKETQVYALPQPIRDMGVQRYGFHGLSYDFLSTAISGHVPDSKTGRVVAAHLGSGASLCAILDGRSVATSMGFTALDGLPMAKRCGDLDPGALLYLINQKGMDPVEIERILYEDSGLKGLSGGEHDMGALLGRDDELARLAVNYFCHRVIVGIAEMAGAMGGMDTLVFAGGIGENAPEIRRRVTAGLRFLGIRIDEAANQTATPRLTASGASTETLVIRTDEQRILHRDALALL